MDQTWLKHCKHGINAGLNQTMVECLKIRKRLLKVGFCVKATDNLPAGRRFSVLRHTYMTDCTGLSLTEPHIAEGHVAQLLGWNSPSELACSWSPRVAIVGKKL